MSRNITKCLLVLYFLLTFFMSYSQKISNPIVNSVTCGTVSGTKIIFPEAWCYDTWELVPEASDEFDGNSVDLSKWAYFPGWGYSFTLGSATACPYQDGSNYANGDLAYYTNGSNLEVTNGTLKLLIKQENLTAKVRDYESDNMILPDGLPNLRTWQFTSGSLVSKQKYSAGKYEIRCKLPKIDGLWPALWLYGDHEQEIDILESGNLNFTEDANTSSKTFGSTTHRNPTNPYQASPNGHDNHCHTGGTEKRYTSDIDLSEDFHIYSVEWDAYEVIFNIDNHIVYKYAAIMNELSQPIGYGNSACNVPTAAYFPLPDVLPTPSETMNIIINCGVANFCSPSNPLSRGTYPATMEVDYIRVFKRVPVPPGPIYTCTPFRSADISINQNNFYGTDVKHIANSITNDGSLEIHSGANVWWTAGSYLEFTDGFTVDAGADFTAEIANCEHGIFRMAENHANNNDGNNPNSDLLSKDSSLTKTIHVSSNTGLTITPNPTDGVFILSLVGNDLQGTTDIFIYNNIGQLIYQSSIINNQSTIDLSAQPRGIYFVKVQSAGKIYTEKVVVQ